MKILMTICDDNFSLIKSDSPVLLQLNWNDENTLNFCHPTPSYEYELSICENANLIPQSPHQTQLQTLQECETTLISNIQFLVI